VSLVPIFVALVIGGYIGKMKLPGGVEFESVVQNLPAIQPQVIASGKVSLPEATSFQAKDVPLDEAGKMRKQRGEEIQRIDLYFLVHVYKRSTSPGQKYDIRLFIIRHIQGAGANQKEGFAEIEKAEFYFGRSWGNRVFPVLNDGGAIGVSTSAWGTFLATCRLTFKDPNKPPIMLFRYVDFEMASLSPSS